MTNLTQKKINKYFFIKGKIDADQHIRETTKDPRFNVSS
jgi:hypothetical protein